MKATLQTPTPDVKQSIDFYLRLGFQLVSEGDVVVMADRDVIVEINSHKFARAGVRLYQNSWLTEVTALESITKVMEIDGGYLLADPSNTWIYLMELDAPEVNQAEMSASILGNNFGWSFQMVDRQKGFDIWSALGFELTDGDLSTGCCCTLARDGYEVCLMTPNSCPHMFFNPSLNYFNGKENNPIVIQKIREAKIPITEEITFFNPDGIVDNIIIRDPGGYGFFIFND